MFSTLSSPAEQKNVDDILKQLEAVTLSGDDTWQPKDHDAGMAKLHALLTGKSQSSATTLKRATSKALKSQKYYRRATEIFNQPHDDGVDVFPFLALPAELRLLVYYPLLVTDDRLILNWRGPKRASKQQKCINLAIMLTCKLCANEGAGVLYGENVFDFEEIRRRPSIAKPLLNRIGTVNASLIRFVVCEYSAASEELSQISDSPTVSETHQLTLSYLESFFSEHNINLDKLRTLAISVIPYGFDDATTDVMKIQAPVVAGSSMTAQRVAWLGRKNKGLEKLVEGICEREGRLRKVDFFGDVDRKIGFDWSPPFSGRLWIAYVKE